MNIAIITTNLRLCGLTRELIEMSNSLKYLGAKTTIFVYEYMKVDWIKVNSDIVILKNDVSIETDVLILMDAPHDYLLPYFYNATAKFKTYIITGLDKEHCKNFVINLKNYKIPKDIIQNGLFNNYEICADGKWQLDFLKEQGIKVGEKMGGINTQMFYDMKLERSNEILISGDTRWMKGYDMLMEVLKDEKYITYQKTRNQKELCTIYNQSLIYIDNHTWAGWCNPVLEAMACGCAVICSNIGATNEFAINEVTALVVKPNDTNGFKKALKRLRNDQELVKKLSSNAIEKAKEFEYGKVITNFYNYLKMKVNNYIRDFWEHCDSHMAHLDNEYIKDNPISWVNNYLNKLDLSNKVVIDYGLGNGLLGTILFRLYNIKKYIGIDIAQRQLDVAKKNLKGNNIEFHLSPLNFASLNADIFISQAVIQHFPNIEYLIDFLQNVNRSKCKDVVLHIRNGKTKFNTKLEKREDWRLACHTNSEFINKYLTNYNLISESSISKSKAQYLIYKIK